MEGDFKFFDDFTGIVLDGYDLADIALIDSIDMMVDDLEDGDRR